MPTDAQPLSFSELVDVHDSLKDNPYFSGMDLPSFSKFMKEQTGSTAYDAGLSDNFIKRGSLAVDRFLQPAAEAAGNVGASIAEHVGVGRYSDVVRRTMEGLPRSFLETLPVVGGAAMLPTPFAPVGAALIGAGGASAGAKTYTDTSSGLAGLISGGATVALPGVASLGRTLIAKPLINKLLFKPVVEQVGEEAGKAFAATTLVPRFTEAVSGFGASELAKTAEAGLETVGANIGVIVSNELAGQAASVAAGQGLYNPLTQEHAAELAAGVLPFAALDAAMHVHGRLTKNFSSRTGQENAAYLGQVREAQQLADIADQITRYRTTDKLSNRLPASVDPEGPPIPPGLEPKGPIVTPPGPFEPKMTYTQMEARNAEARQLDEQANVQRNMAATAKDVEQGILTGEEGAQRVENMQKVSAALQQAATLSPETLAQPFKPPTVKTDLRQLEKRMKLGTVSTEEGRPGEVDLSQTTPGQVPSPERPTLPSTAPSPFAAQLGAKDYFTKYFTNLGLSEGEVGRYTDIAQKIAAAFTDVSSTRIGELVKPPPNVGGAYFAPDRDLENGFVGLVQKQKYGSKALNIFGALQVMTHEMWHATQNAAESGKLDPVKAYQYDQLAKASAGLEPDERTDLYHHVVGMMVPKELRGDAEFEKIVEARSRIAGDNHREFMSDMASLFGLGLLSPDGLSRTEFIKNELRFSAPLLQQFARAMYVPMRDIAKATQEYAMSGLGGKGPTVGLGNYLENLSNQLGSILADGKVAQRAMDALAAIQKNDPAYYEQLRANAEVTQRNTMREAQFYKDDNTKVDIQTSTTWNDAKDIASKVLGLTKRREMEKELGVQPHFLERWGYPFAQLAAAYPQLQGINNIVRSYSSLANEHLSQLMAPFLTKPSKFGHVTVDPEARGLQAVASSQAAELAFRKLGLVQNEVAKAEKRRLTDQEINQIVPDSTPQKREIVDLFKTLTKEGGTYEDAANMQVHAAGLSVSHALASVMMGKNPALKFKDAILYGTGVRDAVIASGNPLRAAEAQQKLAMLTQTAGPQAVQSAVEVAKPMLEAVQKMDQMFQNTPGYSPETRLGQYLVLWKKQGSKEWGSFASDDFAAAKSRLDKVRAEGADVAKMVDKTDKRAQASGMDPTLVERWNDIRSAAESNAIKQLGESTDEMARFRQVMSKGEDAIMTEIKSRGLKQNLLPRKLAEGREDTNAILGMLNYVAGVSHGLAKQYTKEQAGLAFQDPELRQSPKLLDLATKHLNNVVNPSAPELTLLKKMNFAYFMGFNFSSMMIEGSQGVLTFVPQITRDTGSIAEGYKTWGRAVSQVVQAATAKDGKLKNIETQQFLERAIKEGRVDAGVMQEFNTAEENLIPNLKTLASGSGTLTKAGELVKKPLYWYLHASRWLYSWAPRANSQVAFVGAFDTAKSKLGMSSEQAYDYAVTTVDRTMFGGGKAGRPVEPFANTGKLQGVAGLMYSLQTYTLSTIAMMARLGKDAISTSDRLSGPEKVAARKAFGQMMLTQVALGGAMSLPMTAGVVALIDQLFPEAEAKRHVKEALHNTLDSESGLFAHLSDIALKGLPDAAGLDLSSRVGLSGLLGVNPYSGFQVGNLVGPFGSVVENTVKAVQAASEGDMRTAARSILPTPYKNVLQLAQDGGQVKNQKGELLYEPGAAEKVLMSVGFRPTSVTDRQEAAQLVKKSNEVQVAQLAQFHGEQRDALLRGDVNGVRTALLQRAAADKLYDPRAGAKRVVEMAQAATVPFDVSRSGARSGAQTRQNIAAMYSLTPGPTEQSLLLQRKSLERTLQIPGAGALSPTEMVVARTVDYLMSIDPHLPRAEARQQAERMLGRGLGPRL